MSEQVRFPKDAFLILVGPSGSGKTTFAHKHFRRTEVLSSDFCRALVSDDAGNQAVSGAAFELLYFIAAKRMRYRRRVVVDTTALRRSARNTLIKLAREYGYRPVAILFNVPLEECLRRQRYRRRAVPEEVVRRQYEQFQFALAEVYEEDFEGIYLYEDGELYTERPLPERPAPLSEEETENEKPQPAAGGP